MSNDRLVMGMAISVLVHALVFFSLGSLLQFHPTKASDRKIEKLEVRLTPSHPPKIPVQPDKKFPTTQVPAPAPSTEEARASQRSVHQAQIVILQLKQLLVKRLEVFPAMSGKCVLVRKGVNDKLVCDSPAMYEVLYADEKVVVEMLTALRGMGRILNGFSAEISADKSEILWIEEGAATNDNKVLKGGAPQ